MRIFIIIAHMDDNTVKVLDVGFEDPKAVQMKVEILNKEDNPNINWYEVKEISVVTKYQTDCLMHDLNNYFDKEV